VASGSAAAPFLNAAAKPSQALDVARAAVRPVRVLHVVPQLAIGGTELALARLIRGLDRSQFEHSVCAMRGCRDWGHWAEQFGFSPTVVEGTERGLRFPMRRLVRIMREARPDVVHTRNWGALEAVLAAQIAGVPAVVHSEHGYDPAMLSGLPLRRRVFRRAMYSMADTLFTVTAELGHYHAAQAWINERKFRVIHNGVDTDRFRRHEQFREQIRREFNFGLSDVVIGWAGRMAPIKDLPTLFRAAARVAQKFTAVRLLICGNGPERKVWQELAESIAPLKGRTVFAGERHDIPAIMSAMDIFVLPSIREGMSNTLLEAMAAELPVIATSAGGNREIVEDGVSGFLFAPGDVEKLTCLLDHLAQNPDLRLRFGQAARRRVESDFSLRRMIEQYSELYQELARPRLRTEHVRN
jgi:sugar transferase (PEP-CTERM/EpsH1 system associated)